MTDAVELFFECRVCVDGEVCGDERQFGARLDARAQELADIGNGDKAAVCRELANADCWLVNQKKRSLSLSPV